MLLPAILLQCIGTYVLYGTSLRADHQYLPGRKWLQTNRRASIATGSILLVVSLMLSVLSLGLGAGIFSGVVIMMTIFSLMIIVFPLKSL